MSSQTVTDNLNEGYVSCKTTIDKL
jgi:hypothetical protein